jgi:hypothetical protein
LKNLTKAPAGRAGEREVASFNTSRKIALLIALLKVELKESVPPECPQGRTDRKRLAALSDADLSERLNLVWPKETPRYTFNGDKVNQLLNAKIELTPQIEAKLFHALQILINQANITLDVKSDLPRWVEDTYAKELRELLRQPQSQLPIRGIRLGELADVLTGVWQFFYISPTNDKGLLKPQIRGFGVIFQPADISSMGVISISGRRIWSGSAYQVASHLYIVCADKIDRAVEFFVTNVPTRHYPMVVGTGAGLELFTAPRLIPASIGFACFGKKAESGSCSADVFKLIKDVQLGEDISKSTLTSIRKVFSTSFDEIDTFRATHPELASYVESHSLNGNKGLSMATLHVAYP